MFSTAASGIVGWIWREEVLHLGIEAFSDDGLTVQLRLESRISELLDFIPLASRRFLHLKADQVRSY